MKTRRVDCRMLFDSLRYLLALNNMMCYVRPTRPSRAAREFRFVQVHTPYMAAEHIHVYTWKKRQLNKEVYVSKCWFSKSACRCIGLKSTTRRQQPAKGRPQRISVVQCLVLLGLHIRHTRKPIYINLKPVRYALASFVSRRRRSVDLQFLSLSAEAAADAVCRLAVEPRNLPIL
jgi:hypothetical protein